MSGAVAAEARSQADAVAAAAGVEIRRATRLDDYDRVVALMESIWGPKSGPDASFVHALAHAGNTILMASRGGELIGVVLGFLGWDDGIHLHSHVAAVTPAARGGVGFALKLAQRALCLENGVTEIRWTYDPLIRRNAHLNLVKLGAAARVFLPDFYGVLGDAISGTDNSDRFEVRWVLDSERARDAVGLSVARAMGSAASAEVRAPAPSARYRFTLHPDYEALRRDEPDAAARLRAEARAVFIPAFADGLTPELRDGDYLFA